MYYIGDLDAWKSLKKPLNSFKDAFMLQQLKDPSLKIYYWDGENHECVWDPKWEKIYPTY